MPSLTRYREKRDPERTPEPFGALRGRALPQGAWRSFVVQQHRARRMHWDFRLEIDGALASWAVPKGPSLDPQERRLAVRTEDHPMEYADFEGIIPAGGYGAGAVIVWDQGRYATVGGTSPAGDLEAGKLDLVLAGHKLRGRFALVRTRSNEQDGWLLLCKQAVGSPAAGARADEDVVAQEPRSILSGLTVEELASGSSRDDELGAVAAALDAPRAVLDLGKIEPMLATAAEAPFSRPGWLFELKHDGVRVLVKRSGAEVEMRSRRGREVRTVYPEIANAVSRLPASDFVLDGEVCALDDTGRSRFELMQRRMGLADESAIERARVEVPVVLYAFDLLAVAGHDLRAVPLVERKRLLSRFVPGRGVVRLSDHVEDDGKALYEAAEQSSLEGIVAKRADSTYQSGRRAQSWLKIKIPRRANLIIVGTLPVRGEVTSIGALMLAWYRDGTLVYAGNIGSGLSERKAADLEARLASAYTDEPRFTGGPARRPAGARYVEPRYVCSVRFTEVTEAGLLRQPIFLDLRDDVAPETCLAPAARATEEELDSVPPRDADAAEASAQNSEAPEDEGRLQLTRLDKIFWPDEGYTKGDLLAYHEAVWPWIGPYLDDRPIVLTRYPDGIAGKSFFQHNAPEFAPRWAHQIEIDGTRHFLVSDLQTLLYVINSGAIPLHVWTARTRSIERPDWLLLDLDPKDAPFAHVVEVALSLHRMLDELGTPNFVKTSGQAGLHVLVPLGKTLDHEQAKLLAEVIARVICAESPAIATIVRPIAGRGGRVYVDYGQNGRGKLMAAPLSVRPRPRAPVSMPLPWSQITPQLEPTDFNLRTAVPLLAKHGDPLRAVLDAPADLERVLHALTERLAARGTAGEASAAAGTDRVATPKAPRARRAATTKTRKAGRPKGARQQDQDEEQG